MQSYPQQPNYPYGQQQMMPPAMGAPPQQQMPYGQVPNYPGQAPHGYQPQAPPQQGAYYQQVPNQYGYQPPPPQGAPIPNQYGYGQQGTPSYTYSQPQQINTPFSGQMNYGYQNGQMPMMQAGNYQMPMQNFYAPSVPLLSEAEIHRDCEVLKKAMKGLGTDEKAIISILANRTADQTMQIVNGYATIYQKNLAKELQSELSGDFWRFCDALVTPPAEFDARCLQKAMKGAGTDEKVLIEIFVGRSNNEIESIKRAFAQSFNNDLEKQIKSETSGDFEKILLALLSERRDENPYANPAQISSDVHSLYKAGEGKFGTDEAKFIELLSTRSEAHLREVFRVYEEENKKMFEDIVKSEFSGDIERCLLAIVSSIKDRASFVAVLFEEAMKGMGTDDDRMIRLATRHRDPRVMANIKTAYHRKFSKMLHHEVGKETSGDYKKLLQAIIKE